MTIRNISPISAWRALPTKAAWYPTHDNLIGRYDGADGIKTGYTGASGFNLVSSVTRGTTHLIAVVMGGRTAMRRDLEMVRLLDQTFAQVSANPNLVARATMPWRQVAQNAPAPAMAGSACRRSSTRTGSPPCRRCRPRCRATTKTPPKRCARRTRISRSSMPKARRRPSRRTRPSRLPRRLRRSPPFRPCRRWWPRTLRRRPPAAPAQGRTACLAAAQNNLVKTAAKRPGGCRCQCAQAADASFPA